MGNKKQIALLGLVFIFATSCSTFKKRPPLVLGPHQSDDSQVTESKDPLLMPPEIQSKDLESEVISLSRIEQLKRSPVAFWIDGAGFDSIEALGFMQTLDKVGIKPSLVVGTGFGCWIALSWAIDGSGNRAEWQTFKWNDWKLLGDSSILNRLRGRPDSEQFGDELAKIFPPQELKSLKVPVDCPYLQEKKGLYFYRSSSSDKVHTALWRQLKIDPLIGRAKAKKFEDESKTFSGYSFSWPETSAIRFVTMEVGQADSSYTWIVLKGFRGGKSLTAAQLKFMNPQSQQTLAEMRSRGLLYSLSSSYPFSASDIKDPKKRRQLLLRGRKEGEKFLNRLLNEDLINEEQNKKE